MREFINYDSQVFKTTVNLMKKYNLASHHYQDWVDPSEYDESYYTGVALDTCNRLYVYHEYFDIEDNIETVKEIFYFWGGSNAREDTKINDKIELFVKDLLVEYMLFEKIRDKINRNKIRKMYLNED